MEELQKKATILAVDDSRVMLVAAAKALKNEFEVLKASDGAEAWGIIQQHPEIALVFSDLSMPEMDGYGLLSAIRSSDNAQIAKLPVVILTGQEDGDGTKEKVMAAGATDYLVKPFESLDLLSRARSLATLSTQVTELEKKVSLDKLTRLYTEGSFKDSGERAVSFAVRHNTPLSLVRFDIDNFSAIFVKHGKEVAESILKKISDTIKGLLRQEDVAARLGVAKFALLLIETDSAASHHVIERLRGAIYANDFGIAEKIDISVGVFSPETTDQLKFDSASQQAEQALEKALAQGKGQTVYLEDAARAEASGAEAAGAQRGPRIDLSAVLREIENNQGQRLGEKQLNAALNSMLPLLSFLNEKMSLDMDEAIRKLQQKVQK